MCYCQIWVTENRLRCVFCCKQFFWMATIQTCSSLPNSILLLSNGKQNEINILLLSEKKRLKSSDEKHTLQFSLQTVEHAIEHVFSHRQSIEHSLVKVFSVGKLQIAVVFKFRECSSMRGPCLVSGIRPALQLLCGHMLVFYFPTLFYWKCFCSCFWKAIDFIFELSESEFTDFF